MYDFRICIHLHAVEFECGDTLYCLFERFVETLRDRAYFHGPSFSLFFDYYCGKEMVNAER